MRLRFIIHLDCFLCSLLKQCDFFSSHKRKRETVAFRSFMGKMIASSLSVNKFWASKKTAAVRSSSFQFLFYDRPVIQQRFPFSSTGERTSRQKGTRFSKISPPYTTSRSAERDTGVNELNFYQKHFKCEAMII
ncbi:hypothetical protein CEXT_101061 [Caerostris extrusa]|uniref:Uncharacterized protein n=1 Tax=Caerostris extrusa TaxID=172846 RepID=A0AAV4XCG9_CAEEX|nr:hypothetical protein CEXT_101061 [Caerostris extrusa]